MFVHIFIKYVCIYLIIYVYKNIFREGENHCVTFSCVCARPESFSVHRRRPAGHEQYWGVCLADSLISWISDYVVDTKLLCSDITAVVDAAGVFKVRFNPE